MSRLKKYLALLLAVGMIIQYGLVSFAEDAPAEPVVSVTDTEDADIPETTQPEELDENEDVSEDAADETAASAADDIEDTDDVEAADAEFTVYAKWTKSVGETPVAPDWAISKSKTATDLDKNYESKVTLSLPAADWQRDMDVVFVLDKSTSHKQTDIVNQAVDMLENLSEKDNLNIKAGVVVFAKELMDESSQSLVTLDKAGLAELEAIMTKDFDEESGTNLQAGVEAARALLNADAEVGEQDKYIVLLTDGGARQFLNVDGETVSQVYKSGDGGKNHWGSNSDFTEGRYANNNPYHVPRRTFEEVWADTQNVEDNTYTATEAAQDQIEGAAWSTVTGDPNYYTSMERAVYYGAKSIVDASDEANIIFVSYPYYKIHECGNLYAYTESFKDWLETHQLVSMYNTEDLEASGIFEQVENELIYAVDAGSTVLDVIGYDDTYNNGMGYHFDFVNDIKKLTLTVGGDALNAVQIDDTTYGFGEADGSKDGTTYPFVLHYYPNGTNHGDRIVEDECFVWDINVPIMKNAQVQLTYSVLLTDPTEVAGSYTELNTNLEAVLYPKDSNGQDLPAEWFEKPVVKYTVTDKQEQPTTPDKKTEKPKNTQKSKTPKTGDQSNLALWGSLLGASVVVLILAGVFAKKNRKRRR